MEGPIVIKLGSLLNNGSILLDSQIPEGSFWQSKTQRLFTNGTLVDRNKNRGVITDLKLATINQFGFAHILGPLDLEMLKLLDIG